MKSKIRVWGGDGERQDAPDDGADNQNKDQQDSGQSDNSSSEPNPDTQTDSSDSDNKPTGPSIEEQLDAERKKSIAQAKELEKYKTAQKKAAADKDAAKERDDAIESRDKLQAVLDTKFLAWSIATDTKYDWENADDVRVFIKPDEININLDSGEVEGLDIALKRIAKEKPYLLKRKRDEGGGRPPSGQAGQGRGTGIASDEAEKKRLGEKFKIPGYGSQNLRVL